MVVNFMEDFIVTDAVDIVDDCNSEIRSQCSSKDVHKKKILYFHPAILLCSGSTHHSI